MIVIHSYLCWALGSVARRIEFLRLKQGGAQLRSCLILYFWLPSLLIIPQEHTDKLDLSQLQFHALRFPALVGG